MKGKMSSGMDTNMIIAGIVIAIVVIGLIFVLIGRKSKEQFGNKTKEYFGNNTYEFRVARAGHGSASGSLTNSGSPKDEAQKKWSAEKCTFPGKKGHWVCNTIRYPDGRNRTGCGCLYDTPDNDKYNLFNNES